MPNIPSSDKKKLAKKYHDQPRFPVITNGYEQEMKDLYEVTLKKSLILVTKRMVEMKKK